MYQTSQQMHLYWYFKIETPKRFFKKFVQYTASLILLHRLQPVKNPVNTTCDFVPMWKFYCAHIHDIA